MKQLLVCLFAFVSISASAQWATYTPIETPKTTTSGNKTVIQPAKVKQKEEVKEDTQRTTGYYANLQGGTSRVSIKFTVKESYTGEVLTLVGYYNGVSWVSIRTRVDKTGYGDPKNFDYKVGIAHLGTVYFNY
ncbi:hypothetical protein [Dysgonomonas reticulitermitis]